MNINVPDKWIRKAIYDAFNGTIVDGKTINVFDSRQTQTDIGVDSAYVLMSTQSNDVIENKCNGYYTSSIRLEVIVFYSATGNSGSRLLADNILDALRAALDPEVTLDVSSNLKVISQNFNFPSDAVTAGNNKSIYRKFLDLTVRIE